MKNLTKGLLWAFVVTTLVGSCLHFLYDLLPNPVTAIISPVNESIWEHVKLIYWPLLVVWLLVLRKEVSAGAWALGMLAASGGMLLLGWLYHIVLGGETMAIDVAIYVAMMAVGFRLPFVLEEKKKGEGKSSGLPVLLVVALGAAIVLFTFLPPDHVLFADLSGTNTWTTIPY